MEHEEVKKKIFAFLNQQELGVISTIHAEKNAPESAVVGIGNNENLELVFGTSTKTRKYKNIQQNPNIAFAIGFTSVAGYIQYEGVATELTQEEAKEYSELLIKKHDSHKINIAQEDHRLFRVKPTWIRFVDNAASPPNTYELTF